MSIKSWKKEFYSIKAKDASHPLEHSLVKWIGLRHENLKRHELHVQEFSNIGDKKGNIFRVDSSSCALCLEVNTNCSNCCLESCSHEFDKWEDDHNPEPMIKLLLKAAAKSAGGKK